MGGLEAAAPLARSDPSHRIAPPLAAMREAWPFARVSVHRDASEILDAWADLEASAPCTIYQTRAFVLPWIETLGHKAGVAPLFVLARAADAAPVALLCLGLARRGSLTVASWLGGKDVNLALPLARPGSAWSRESVSALLRRAAEAHDGALDLFILPNQPHHWRGLANPLALLPHQVSPSAAHGTALPREAEDFFARKLSRETRKKLRKKEARLAAMGPLVHRIAATETEAKRIVEAFLALKVARFRALGIKSEFEAPAMRAFLEAAHASGGLELHALETSGRIIAVYGGAHHGGQWSGMVNAFDPDETIAKSSPGDLLLMRIVAKACADGLTGFDLGIGEARYKAALCDEPIALLDVIVPTSWRGRLAAGLVAMHQRTKRLIKQDPRLIALVKRGRALRARFRR